MEKSLKKNSFFNILYNLANILFPLVTSMYASRILLSEGIGKVAYGQNIASYFVAFAALGLPTYGVREIAKARDDRRETDRLFAELFSINAIFTTLAVGAYLILIFSVPRFYGNLSLFLCCGLQVVMGYLNIDWFYQGEEEYRYITIRSILVKAICLCLVFAFVKTPEDTVKYALISSLAVTVNSVFNMIYVRHFVKPDFRGLNLRRHLPPLMILALSVFLASAYSKIDVTMLGSLSTERSTGLYSNSHRIVEMVMVVCASVSAVFLPRLSYHYEHNPEEFRRLIELGIKVLSFIALPCTVGLFLLAPEVLLIFYGPSFLEGGTVMRILSVLIVIKSVGNLLCYQLVIATGNEKKRLPAYCCAAVLNILLNAVLIPKMAQNGAAIASVISELAVNGIQLYAMCRIIRIPVPGREIMQGVLTTAAMGAAVWAVKALTVNLYWRVSLCVMTGVILYLCTNVLIRNEVAMAGIRLVQEKCFKNK